MVTRALSKTRENETSDQATGREVKRKMRAHTHIYIYMCIDQSICVCDQLPTYRQAKAVRLVNVFPDNAVKELSPRSLVIRGMKKNEYI